MHKLFTLVPRCSKSRANGRIPSTISTPLLSTKIAAHLWGTSFCNLCIHSSKSSTNHGLPKLKNTLIKIIVVRPFYQKCFKNFYFILIYQVFFLVLL